MWKFEQRFRFNLHGVPFLALATYEPEHPTIRLLRINRTVVGANHHWMLDVSIWYIWVSPGSLPNLLTFLFRSVHQITEQQNNDYI